MEQFNFNIDDHTPEEALEALTRLAYSAPSPGSIADSLNVAKAIEIASNTLKKAIEEQKE